MLTEPLCLGERKGVGRGRKRYFWRAKEICWYNIKKRYDMSKKEKLMEDY